MDDTIFESKLNEFDNLEEKEEKEEKEDLCQRNTKKN